MNFTTTSIVGGRPRSRSPLRSAPAGIVSTTSALLLAVLAADPLPGQSHVRGFGRHVFDTSLHDVSDFTAVASGGSVTLAIRAGGEVVGWGSAVFRIANVPELALPALEVEAAPSTAAALLTDGTVVAWGYANGVSPLPPGLTYTDVAVSDRNGAAVRSDGQVVVWGESSFGQTTPPSLPVGTTYVAVDTGDSFVVALRSDGELVAWGRNHVGQTNVPTAPPGIDYVAIACGRSHSLALRSDGGLDAWGSSSFGELNVPALPSGTTWVQAVAGNFFSAALASDGVVRVWGFTAHGQNNVPALPAGVAVVQIAAGDRHCAMLRSDGRIVSWAGQGYFERNFEDAHAVALPVAIDAGDDGVVVLGYAGGLVSQGFGYVGLPAAPAGLGYSTIATEGGRSAAIRSDGEAVLSSWLTPLPTLPVGVDYVDADVGLFGAYGLRSDGLTEATAAIFNLPQPPPGLSYVAIEASDVPIGLLSDGNVVFQGLVGASVPALPPGLRYVAIASGSLHGVCLRSDGRIVTWSNSPTTPAPALPAGTTYVEIAADGRQTVARRSDGTLVAWPADPTTAPSRGNGTVVAETTGLANSTYNAIGAGDGSTVAIMGPASTFVTFAPGCSGSLPSARIIPEDTPKIGEDLVVRVFDLPAGFAFLAAGFSNTMSPLGPLPQSAAPFGMPGCTIHISPDVTAFVAASGPNDPAERTVSIPNDLGLLGTTFYQQAVIPDPGVNAAGFVLSDAVECVVGR